MDKKLLSLRIIGSGNITPLHEDVRRVEIQVHFMKAYAEFRQLHFIKTFAEFRYNSNS
jgi:hypothetical protein